MNVLRWFMPSEHEAHALNRIADAFERLAKIVECDPRRSGSHFATKHDLRELKEEIMSAMSDALSAFDTQMTAYNDAQDTAIEGLQGDVKNMQDQILVLQNDTNPAWTPENQAVLDKIQARAKNAADKLAALDALTPPVVPPVA